MLHSLRLAAIITYCIFSMQKEYFDVEKIFSNSVYFCLVSLLCYGA
jgi:hypothetical protein